jgi:hypothetical protein
VRLEPTIRAFERAKTVHALDRVATVIGIIGYIGMYKQENDGIQQEMDITIKVLQVLTNLKIENSRVSILYANLCNHSNTTTYVMK